MIMRPIRLASHLVSKNSLSKPIHISHIPSYIHERQHFARTMATARIIDITPENTGLTGITQSKAAAKKATEILQEDLEVGLLLFILIFSRDGSNAELNIHNTSYTTASSMMKVSTTSKLISFPGSNPPGD